MFDILKIRCGSCDRVLNRFDEILVQLKELNQRYMALSGQVQAFAQKVDAASNQIAAKIQRLLDKQTGISQEDQAEFDKIVSSLEQLGKDEEPKAEV